MAAWNLKAINRAMNKLHWNDLLVMNMRLNYVLPVLHQMISWIAPARNLVLWINPVRLFEKMNLVLINGSKSTSLLRLF